MVANLHDSELLEVEDHLLHSLGRLVVQSSALEESLKDAIWRLVGIKGPEAHLMTAGMGFRTLVDKFGLLYAVKRKDGDAQAFCNRLESLATERNRLVHAFWDFGLGGDAIPRYRRSARRKHGLRFNPDRVSPAEVLDLVEKLAAADDKLWELVSDLDIVPK